jgi:hypothetical protein
VVRDIDNSDHARLSAIQLPTVTAAAAGSG